MPDQTSPFELPSLDQQRVKHSEMIQMFSAMIKSRMSLGRTGAGLIEFRERTHDEILELSAGSGYYKLNPHALIGARHLKTTLSPDSAYFGIDAGNLQVLVTLDPRGMPIIVRGRAGVGEPWTEWHRWKNDNVDLPFDRFLLQSELAQHV